MLYRVWRPRCAFGDRAEAPSDSGVSRFQLILSSHFHLGPSARPSTHFVSVLEHLFSEFRSLSQPPTLVLTVDAQILLCEESIVFLLSMSLRLVSCAASELLVLQASRTISAGILISTQRAKCRKAEEHRLENKAARLYNLKRQTEPQSQLVERTQCGNCAQVETLKMSQQPTPSRCALLEFLKEGLN